MDFTFEHHETHLAVIVSGTFELDTAVAVLEETLEVSRAGDFRRVLTDMTALNGFESAVLRVLFALQGQERYQRYLAEGGEPLRIAFLGGKNAFSSFMPALQLVRLNRGPVEIFTDRAKAMAWLAEESS